LDQNYLALCRAVEHFEGEMPEKKIKLNCS